MKPRRLWQVSVRIHPEAEEAVTALLADVFDQAAMVHCDLRAGTTVARVYSSAPAADLKRRLRTLCRGLDRIRQCGLNTGTGRPHVRKLRPQDWSRSWKRHFHPVAIDQALLIKPSWTRRRARAGRAVVVIDPGLSFGTGQHPTTRYCLQQIVAVRDAEKGQSFLDVGTGSGILAIAAIRLGFSPVAAFDVDPVAVRIAGANARGNRVAGRIRFRCVDVSRLPIRAARRFDLICANLTADLLVTEAGRLARRLRPGGRLVVAGVLRREFDAVRQAFRRAGLRLTRSRVEEEWRSGVFSAPPKMAT